MLAQRFGELCPLSVLDEMTIFKERHQMLETQCEILGSGVPVEAAGTGGWAGDGPKLVRLTDAVCEIDAK